MRPNVYLKYFLVLTGLALVVFCIKAFGNHAMFVMSFIMLAGYAWAISKVAVDEYGLVEGIVWKTIQKKCIDYVRQNISGIILLAIIIIMLVCKFYLPDRKVTPILIAQPTAIDTKYFIAD